MAPVLQGAIWHAPHDDRGAALSFTQTGRMGGCHGRADPIIATDVPADDRVRAIRLSMELVRCLPRGSRRSRKPAGSGWLAPSSQRSRAILFRRYPRDVGALRLAIVPARGIRGFGRCMRCASLAASSCPAAVWTICRRRSRPTELRKENSHRCALSAIWLFCVRQATAITNSQGPKPWRKADPVDLVRMNDLADRIAEDIGRKARWIGNQRRAAHAVR
jgi:hypothetical protein